MKHATKLPSRAPTAASSSSSSSGTTPPAAQHRLSHAIAKAPPPRKIRIVHVMAPEIIKTEARNFRDLVQRLTGKPAPHSASSSSSPPGSGSGSCDTTSDDGPAAAAIKAEAETSSSSGGGGYLRALEGEDGSNESFFQGLQDFLFSSCNDVEDGFSF